MTDESPQETTDSIAIEIDTVLPGSDPLQNLRAVKTGPVQYSVLSARNGGVTYHRVNLSDPSCTCEDFEYNLNDGDRDVCAHIAKATLVAPVNPDPGEMGVAQLYHVTGQIQDQLDDLETETEMLHDHATNAGVERRSEEAEQATEKDRTTDKGVDPDGKAEALRDAYESVGIDVETTIDVDSSSGEERIWIETAEQVSESKFNAFILEADQLKYDPDEKDGYQNNWIAPRDVDDLIAEVF